MTIPFHKGYGNNHEMTMQPIVMNFMMTTLLIIAAYAYGYVLLLYAGVLHLSQTTTSSLTPVQQFMVGGHVCMAGLFAVLGIKNIENNGNALKTALYLILMISMFALFLGPIITAG